MSTKRWERAWCYYCNLVHSVYREARHIAASGQTSRHQMAMPDARLQVPLAGPLYHLNRPIPPHHET
jgi:hypothetical protein